MFLCQKKQEKLAKIRDCLEFTYPQRREFYLASKFVYPVESSDYYICNIGVSEPRKKLIIADYYIEMINVQTAINVRQTHKRELATFPAF